MELVAAIVASSFFLAIDRPFTHYYYWYTWRTRNLVLGAVLYFLIGGVGGGLIGWLIAQIAHASITPYQIADGVLFGIAGALAIRADFSTATKSGKLADDPSQRLGQAASLLGLGVTWITSMVDTLTQHQVEIWIGGLSNHALKVTSYRVGAKINELPVARAAQVRLDKNLDAALAKLDATGNTQIEGRVLVEQFCTSFYTNHRLNRPR